MVNETSKGQTELASDLRVAGDELHVREDDLAGFAKRLAILKQDRGLRSVRAFADACGLSQTPVQMYFKGKMAPTGASLAKIARSLHVGVDWLMTGEGPMDRFPVGHVMPNGEIIAQGPFMPFDPEPPAQPDPAPAKLFATLDMDRLGRAVVAAVAEFDAANKSPTGRELGMVIALLYDQFTANEAAKTSSPSLKETIAD